jgi:WS/DGAT/MGAT family acyltransferase
MERLTGIDPMFIYSDTPETPMEVAYACVFDPTSAPGGYDFDRIVAVLEERIPDMPAFRRRLMTVPLGIDHPRWVDDPDFDLTNHLHREALPSPGGEKEFALAVAEVLGHPLEPGQPPWEMHVIEGLAGGMVGLIAKMHHAVIDGVAGAQLLAQLLDLTAEGRAVTETCEPWVPARLPTQTALMTDALPSFVTSPLRALRAAREVGRTAVRLVRTAVDGGSGPVALPIGAPPTFELPVGPHRTVTFSVLDLAQVKALRSRFGVTINDVVLAVCSGALRSHLIEHGEEADAPLVAVVPVSVRAKVKPAAAGESKDAGGEPAQTDESTSDVHGNGNQLSAMFVTLSNDLQTPLERLRTVAATSRRCKRQELSVGFGPLASLLSDAVPPVVSRPIIQLGVRSGILRRLRPGNLMISNVPGPNFPLYFAGMQLRAVYPLGPVVNGISLNITVQSYMDSLYVGINAGSTAVPDLPGLAHAMVDELMLLTKVAEGTPPRRPPTGGRHRRAPETGSGTSMRPAMLSTPSSGASMKQGQALKT